MNINTANHPVRASFSFLRAPLFACAFPLLSAFVYAEPSENEKPPAEQSTSDSKEAQLSVLDAEKVDDRFIGEWRGETEFKEDGQHQVYRWWIERKIDGTFAMKLLEYYPNLKVYLLDETSGTWRVIGDTYTQSPKGEDPSVWRVKSAGEARIELLLQVEGQFSSTPDVDVRVDGELGNLLKAPDGFRKVSRDELFDLM